MPARSGSVIAAKSKAVALAAAAFVLLLAAATAPGGAHAGQQTDGDAREAIVLSAGESAEMLRGMRLYLESVEKIISGMSANKMPAVADGAKTSGMAMLGEISILTAAKLPPSFIVMATDTHQKFDALAEAARTAGTKLVVMQHLSAILANCTSCHAMYRISTR